MHATRPLDPYSIKFCKDFTQDVYLLTNVCNIHVCNFTCYQNNEDILSKHCKYGSPTELISQTDFDVETKLLHICRTNQWLNNANLWILGLCKCNHDLKLIDALGKDGKALAYYIIN